MFTVLRIEAHVEHITHELRVMGELFAHACTGRRKKGGIGGPECSEGAEREVCDGIVTIKPD